MAACTGYSQARGSLLQRRYEIAFHILEIANIDCTCGFSYTQITQEIVVAGLRQIEFRLEQLLLGVEYVYIRARPAFHALLRRVQQKASRTDGFHKSVYSTRTAQNQIILPAKFD